MVGRNEISLNYGIKIMKTCKFQKSLVLRETVNDTENFAWAHSWK